MAERHDDHGAGADAVAGLAVHPPVGLAVVADENLSCAHGQARDRRCGSEAHAEVRRRSPRHRAVDEIVPVGCLHDRRIGGGQTLGLGHHGSEYGVEIEV